MIFTCLSFHSITIFLITTFKFFSKMHFDGTKNFQIEYMGLGPDTAQVQKLNFHSLSTMGQAKAGAHQ